MRVEGCCFKKAIVRKKTKILTSFTAVLCWERIGDFFYVVSRVRRVGDFFYRGSVLGENRRLLLRCFESKESGRLLLPWVCVGRIGDFFSVVSRVRRVGDFFYCGSGFFFLQTGARFPAWDVDDVFHLSNSNAFKERKQGEFLQSSNDLSVLTWV